MIDTVRLNFPMEVSPSLLIDWDESQVTRRNGSGYHVYMLNAQLQNSAPVSYNYYAGQAPLLAVEFSLPHAAFGCNLAMLLPLEQTVDLANKELNKSNLLPKIDIWEGNLSRVDIFYNHQVGRDVPYLIHALQYLAYPHRRTEPYSVEGVQFKSQFVTTKFYDKHRESTDAAAYGILRQETTVKGRVVKKLTEEKKPRLYSITSSVICDVLERDLATLGLLGNSIGTRDTTLKRLCDVYGPMGGIYYYGLLLSKLNHQRKEIIEDLTGIPHRTLNSHLRNIVGRGVPLTITYREEPLLPLTIDRTLIQSLAQ